MDTQTLTRRDGGLYFDQGLIFGFNTSSLIVALISVGLRFAGRAMKGLRLGADDILCLLATIAYILQAILNYMFVFEAGAGKPAAAMTASDQAMYLKLAMGVQFPYALAMGLIRASIVILFVRIFSVSDRIRWACYGLLAFIAAWTLYVIISALAICRPLALNWDKTIQGGTCGNITVNYIVVCATGIVLDLAIFIFPLPIIWGLNMPNGQKVALTVVFMTGLFDIVAGAMRLYAQSAGYPADMVEGLIWGTIEPSVAIFVACAPMYRPVFDKIIPSSFWSWTVRSLASSRHRTGKSTQKMDDQIELVSSGYKTGQASTFTKSIGVKDALDDSSIFDPPMSRNEKRDRIGVRKDVSVQIEEPC